MLIPPIGAISAACLCAVLSLTAFADMTYYVAPGGDGELPEAATDCLTLGTDPMFVDSGYRLDRKSPCINAGKRLEWMRNSVDIEGNVRRGSRPDIGCWESDVKPGLSLLVR